MGELGFSHLHLAIQFLEFLNTAGISYVIAGDTRHLPYRIYGDIDVVVDSADMPTFVKKLAIFAEQNEIQIVQALWHEQTACYFVLAKTDAKGRIQYIAPDVCSDYFRCGKLFLKADKILARRITNTTEDVSTTSLSVPSSPEAFIYYLLKRIDKGFLDDRQGGYLSAEWKKDPAGAEIELQRYWPEQHVKLIALAAQGNKWTDVRKNLKPLKEALHSSLSVSIRHYGSEFLRMVRRIFRTTGLHVVFLGTDGSGKSTVLARVEEDLASAFRRTSRYHLRPYFGRAPNEHGRNSNPHGNSPRDLFSSLMKLGLWWLDYTFGYFIEVFPRLVRSTLVLFDRYYYDLLVDQKRYRYGGPLWIARLIGIFIPRPDLVIFLDAPTDVLLQRKQEVCAIEINRQRSAYQELIRKLPNGLLVDASLPFDRVLLEVETLILDFMKKRTAKRLGRVS